MGNQPDALPECVTPDGLTTLYAGNVTGFRARDDRLHLVASTSLGSIPLAGGSFSELFTANDVYGLALVGDDAYVTSDAFSSNASLTRVALGTGMATAVLTPSPPTSFESFVADDDSLYFAGLAPDSVSKLTPPATALETLPLVSVGTHSSIVEYAAYVYVAGWDFAANAGVVQRVAKDGSDSQILLSGLGLVSALAVDGSGVYFVEDPANFIGTGRIVRAAHDGTSPSTFVDASARSLVLGHGRLYYATGAEIRSVPVDGGTPEPITVANGPGALQIAGGNLIWVAPVVKALSDTTIPLVQTTCLVQ